MAKKRGTKEENLISPNENVGVRQWTSGGERKLERVSTNLLAPGDFGKKCRVKKYTTERGMYLAIGNSEPNKMLHFRLISEPKEQNKSGFKTTIDIRDIWLLQ